MGAHERAAETIGERIRRLRLERKLAQRDIAGPGVSAQYVSKVERGDRTPSVKALRKLAASLGVSAQFLETGSDVFDAQLRDFQLDDAELALRLGDDAEGVEGRLRNLLAEATSAGDVRAQTRARLGLGAAASHRGDHSAAISFIEPALREHWVTPLTHPDAFATLGHSLGAVGMGDQAVALFRSCIEEITTRRPVSNSAAARFATYLSYALVDTGSLEEARAAIETALRYGRENDDPYTTIRLYWSSARLAATAGDFDVAQSSVNRAIVLLEATEDTLHLARAHLLAAEIALWDGTHTHAAGHLETAEQLLPEGADVEDRAFLLVQQAFLAARVGDAPAAMDFATNAIRLLTDREDPTIRGRAHWALAEAFAAAGATSSARSAYAEASELIPPGSKHAARLLEAWQQSVATEIS